MSKSSIKLLDEKVSCLLKSHVTIPSLTDALREVIQNSADAKAKNIEICIDFNTLSFIIQDDGIGLNPTELDNIGIRYYTSKVKSLNELKKIKTFGFRGEALHSIASVSTLKIISKEKSFNGSFQVSFKNGRRLQNSNIVDEDSQFFNLITKTSGTIVSVSEIFANLPVRMSQLRKTSESKFLDEIRSIIFHIAVIKPEISITCFKKSVWGNKLISKVIGSNDTSIDNYIISRLGSIYGISIKNHYQLLQASFEDYNITCTIGKFPVQSKLYQKIFYNMRVVNYPQLVTDINKLFADFTFGEQTEIFTSSMSRSDLSPRKGRSPTKIATSVGNPFSRYPLFVMKIDGPQSLSDVIQNPSKKVEFSKHFSIIAPLSLKMLTSFLNINHVPSSKIQSNKKNASKDLSMKSNHDSSLKFLLKSGVRTGKIIDHEIKGMSIGFNGEVPELINPDIVQNIIKRQKLNHERPKISINYECCVHGNEDNWESINKSIDRNVLLKCKIISQVDKKFIMIKNQNHLYIIDQHACDERIRVEQLLAAFISIVHNPFKELAIPLKEKAFTLELSFDEIDLFAEYSSNFEKWGIKYETCDQFLSVTHFPEILHSKIDDDLKFIKKCLLQYAIDLHLNLKLKTIPKDWLLALQAVPTIILDLINSKACRSAIMFGKDLKKDEIQHLIEKLSTCKLPFQCAHGRPSIVPLCDLSKFNK